MYGTRFRSQHNLPHRAFPPGGSLGLPRQQNHREDYRGEGQEVLRSLLWNAPKWGNDDAYVDSIAKDVLEFCLRDFAGYTTCAGGQLLSGIHQPHPNVLDAGALRQAQAEPKKFKDLIVRLWGVSAHFVDLPRELQDEMIARLS